MEKIKTVRCINKTENIVLPDINDVINKLVDIESSFDGKKQSIALWIQDQRNDIRDNIELINNKSEENDIKILLIFVHNMLVRAMKGEKGVAIYNELQKRIKSRSDLTDDNYKSALEEASYRWGSEKGVAVISGIVKYFEETLDWDWNQYLSLADENRKTNFLDDEILKIKNIGYKLRDLALSSFNPHYAAFDLHVSRVPTRLGLLNYGYDLLKDSKLEMGNNPGNVKNYLFLHKLFMKLSQITNNKYLAVDFDRIFWHFGKTICGSKPKCDICPVKPLCLTGQYK